MTGADSLKVQGVTAYPAIAASARVRLAAFEPFLQEHGVSLAYRPTLTDSEYALLMSGASPVRKAVALTGAAARAARLMRTDSLLLVHRLLLLAPLPWVDPPPRVDVYDFDDALFVGSAADANRSYQWLKQEPRRARACVKRARQVIASNSVLATDARRLSTSVEVIPSCVDPSSQALREHSESDVVTVGWIGSHTTCAYLDPVIPVVERMNRNGTRVRLRVIGGDTGVRASWIEHRPWDLARQAEELSGFDIGIMPLPDDEWTRGKSGYKLLQYFAAGVPAVASPVGINSELLADGRGITAGTGEEWQAALEQLAGSAVERRERGLSARRYVEAHYSYQRWAPELARLLKDLA